MAPDSSGQELPHFLFFLDPTKDTEAKESEPDLLVGCCTIEPLTSSVSSSLHPTKPPQSMLRLLITFAAVHFAAPYQRGDVISTLARTQVLK